MTQNQNNKLSIVFLATDVITVNSFLDHQIESLAAEGHQIHVVCNNAQNLKPQLLQFCKPVPIELNREISPTADLFSLLGLVKTLRPLKADVIISSTPKAGLLGSLASFLLGIKQRIYHVRGLRYETTTGLKRRILTSCEKLNCFLSHHVVSDSSSMKDRLVEHRIVNPHKISILGEGSACGVDSVRFNRSPEKINHSHSLRDSLQMEPHDRIIGFVGRLTKDKGIDDAIAVFQNLSNQHSNIRLVILGDYENGDPPLPQTIQLINSHPHIHHVGHVQNIDDYMALFDVLLFPSYREGFPISLLEAASMELPIVTYNSTGCKDAVVDGTTGAIVPVGDVEALSAALAEYLVDEQKRDAHGKAARIRTLNSFEKSVVTQNWCQYITSKAA